MKFGHVQERDISLALISLFLPPPTKSSRAASIPCVVLHSQHRQQTELAMVDATPERDVVLVWLPRGSKATPEDFARGEPWVELDHAIVHAREAVRRDGMLPWIRCDKKFVLSPEDIFAAYAQVKERG